METRLAKLGITFPFMVGPMVGLSHVAFRELIRSYTPKNVTALRFTEMLSSRRLPSERLDDALALRCAPGEPYFVPQLLGNEERFIEPSVKKLLQQSPWGLDINMGCPESHTLKHNWGVKLMGDKAYAGEVVKMTKRHSSVPVSVKLRSGLTREDTLDSLVDFTDSLEDAGADWLTIHCRPKEAKHTGEANWERVGALAKRRGIPIVANGDIQTAEDALRVIQEFGADGAMIGRAATARPWLLWQITHRLGMDTTPENRDGELPPLTPDEEGREYYRACLKMIELLETYFGDCDFALKKLHFFVANGQRWYLFGHAFWKTTMNAKSLAQARDLILAYAAQHPHPSHRRISFP